MINFTNMRTTWVVGATVQAMLALQALAMRQWPEAVAWVIGTVAAVKVCTLLR